ncbi:MAG: dihydroorotate dehydrogenase electron transfer subunit [Planctomycetes bacterium]|nr:dihydroorotate dehydrogenase electron transfer subunit [Planctomycetota bacterium]
MSILNLDAYVVGQVDYSARCRKITLAVPLREPVRAGQFCHLRCADGTDPLLRRPLSFWDVRTFDDAWANVDLLYTVVGRGTAALAGKGPLDTVGFLGPLGTGFTPSDAGTCLFVAGGVGIVPFYLFAKQLLAGGRKPRIELLFGGRTEEMLYGIDDFAGIGVETHAATEDGSRGTKGLVTDLLERRLRKLDRKGTMLYTCGPDRMIDAVVRIARREKLPCEVSMERRMGCALGACGACVAKVSDGDDWRYSRICIEGPTYDAARLVLE